VTNQRIIRILELRSVRGSGGGPEKTILLGAAGADTGRFHVTVCYIRDRRDTNFTLGERARALGVDYVEVEERHSVDPSILPKLTRLILERRIDLVHAHEYKTDLVALLLARRTGIVPLATAHGWTGQSARERRLYYPVDKRLLAMYPRVLAVSTDIKRELVRHGARDERVTVILNSIDSVAFRRDPARVGSIRASLGIESSDVVIGAVGRIERQKRFDLLIDVMATLVPSRPALRLVIVGNGSLLAEHQARAARLGLGDRCRFLGHREDIVDLHHAFDLFVQSSEYEGTPNAVLEAMAMETPLVATDAGGTSELARPDQDGLIVPCLDEAGLRSAIDRALVDPSAARARASSARRRIESDLSFEARTRRLEHIYAEMLRA
jgi:glycosyltransferase involved in cell wall biosynthesis